MASQRGVVRPRDLREQGWSASRLRSMVTSGRMVRSGWGLYTPADYEVTEFHSLVEAVRAQSRSVVCLASALSFHGVGTQLPHEVWVAVPYGTRISASSVPMRAVVLRPQPYGAGIEMHRLEGVDVPVYGIAKTVADCFKFRNNVGLDVALEALREVLMERRCTREEIRKYAIIDRVEKVMRPYVEALSI